MTTLHYEIGQPVLDMFPGYRLGVLVFDGLANSPGNPQVDAALRETETWLRDAVRGNVVSLPQVAAWRDAFRRFGAKPGEHRSAIEALLRRVLKPDSMPAINTLVDIGTLVSLRFLLPAGVHPLGTGDIRLAVRTAQAGDSFLPVAGGEREAAADGEVVLASGSEVLTRRWTWRQSALTRTLVDTRRIVFNLDALAPIDDGQLAAAMADASQWVTQCCGGRLIVSTVLGAAQPSLTVALQD